MSIVKNFLRNPFDNNIPSLTDVIISDPNEVVAVDLAKWKLTGVFTD